MAKENKDAPWWAPNLQGVVVFSVIVITAAAIFYRMTHPSEVKDGLLDMMLTLLVGTGFIGVVNYAIGSSKGSQAKDEQQTKVVEKLMAAPALTAPAAAAVAAAEAEAEKNVAEALARKEGE